MSSDNLVEVVEVVGRDTSVNLDDPIQHFLPSTADSQSSTGYNWTEGVD